MTRSSRAAFDVIIVGAGTAGCLLANRLSADPQCRVALIEAGGSDDYLWIHVPVGYLYCIGNPRTDWCWQTETETGLNGRAIRYPRGRVLGGCSSINGMIYMRGQRQDYDGWRDGDGYGPNPGWGWDDVLPRFIAHEDHHRGANAHHGAGGEWRVERQRVSWRILDAFARAAAEQGIPPVDDFNRGDNFGCGAFEVNQRRGVRWNAARAFLHPVRRRPNLQVFTHMQVERLLFDGRRCIGVETRRDGQRGQLTARAEVLLAAGAVASPVLLERSGVGEPAHVQALGVPLVQPLAGVGENLQDHLQLRMAFKVGGVRTLNTLARGPLMKAALALQYIATRRGPLTMSPSQLGVFARSDGGQGRANVEYHVQPLSLDRFGEPLHPFDAFTASVCNLRPAARGSVHARATEVDAAPIIQPNYLSAAEDRRVAIDALRLTRRIVASPALARFAPQEFLPGPRWHTDDELAHAAGDVGTTIFHPVGTAKMGPAADPRAVVDADLRVHGCCGLRVIDASIMPTITSGNTNAPTLMLAEVGAAKVRQALRRG